MNQQQEKKKIQNNLSSSNVVFRLDPEDFFFQFYLECYLCHAAIMKNN